MQKFLSFLGSVFVGLIVFNCVVLILFGSVVFSDDASSAEPVSQVYKELTIVLIFGLMAAVGYWVYRKFR